MTVFFAMIGQGDDRSPAFFLTAKSAPEGAIEISDARHRVLLEAQSQGRAIIVDARGRPAPSRRASPNPFAIRPQLAGLIRSEAAARISKVSPEWRQMNDLREPTEAGAIRFARIDAIRAASNAIEEQAASVPIAALSAFPVATHTLWPEFDDA